MEDVPHTPANPPSRVNSITIGTTMGVAMEELSGVLTGGSSILSYDLQMDSSNTGSGPFDIEVGGFTSNSLLTEYTITSLVSG